MRKPTPGALMAILIFLGVLMFTEIVQASEYMVATWGNDSSGNGRVTTPWKTIQFAVDQLQSGDILLVEEGDYRGFVVRRSGTVQAPITIKAKGGGVNIVTDSGTGDDPEERITVNNSNYVIIDGFNVPGDHTSGNGIGAHGATVSKPMQGIVFRNNTVHDVGSGNTYGNTCIYVSNANGAIVENNTVYNCGEHGVYIANAGAKNSIVRGNRIYDTGTNGIHANGDKSIGGDGLLTGLVFSDNIIYGVGQNAINMDGVQDSLISNNLLYRNDKHGVAGYQIDGAAGPQNITIVNNTIDDNNDWAVRFSEDKGGHIIFNNILLSQLGSIRSNSSSAASTYLADYNISSNRYSTDGGGTVRSLDNWQSLTSQDMHSFIGTASQLFTNAGNGDYTLKDGVVAIDSGIASLGGVAAPGVSINGVNRPAGLAYDVGAYEWGTGLVNPLPAPTGLKVWIVPE